MIIEKLIHFENFFFEIVSSDSGTDCKLSYQEIRTGCLERC